MQVVARRSRHVRASQHRARAWLGPAKKDLKVSKDNQNNRLQDTHQRILCLDIRAALEEQRKNLGMIAKSRQVQRRGFNLK